MKILMVCLGNICRSPLAEGVMQWKIDQKGLPWQVDSAGTGSWHEGELPDHRSILTAQSRGLDITKQRARQIKAADLDHFDHILVMDASNYQNVRNLAKNDQQRAKIELIRNFAEPGKNLQVPDPYHGGPDGFEMVFDMLDEACEAFIQQQPNP